MAAFCSRSSRYTSALFGWTFYGILWDVLVGTGIVFLPFPSILIDNWRGSAEGGEFGTVTGLSLRPMELEFFMALLMVVLAGQPAALTPLNAASLNYTPPPTLIDPTSATTPVAAPQSTYGSTGFTGSPATVNISVWWYAALSMTSGFNHAVVEGLPSAADIRTHEQQVRLVTIADPRLRQDRTALAQAPPTWSNDDLVAHNSGSTGLMSTVENVAKGGLASGGVVAASALSSVAISMMVTGAMAILRVPTFQNFPSRTTLPFLIILTVLG